MSSRGAGRSVLAYVVLTLALLDGAVAQAPRRIRPPHPRTTPNVLLVDSSGIA